MKILVVGEEAALRGFRLAGAAVRLRDAGGDPSAVRRDAEAAGAGLVLVDGAGADASGLVRRRPPFVEAFPAPSGRPEEP